jgi:hypothetical protein
MSIAAMDGARTTPRTHTSCAPSDQCNVTPPISNEILPRALALKKHSPLGIRIFLGLRIHQPCALAGGLSARKERHYSTLFPLQHPGDYRRGVSKPLTFSHLYPRLSPGYSHLLRHRSRVAPAQLDCQATFKWAGTALPQEGSFARETRREEFTRVKDREEKEREGGRPGKQGRP